VSKGEAFGGLRAKPLQGLGQSPNLSEDLPEASEAKVTNLPNPEPTCTSAWQAKHRATRQVGDLPHLRAIAR
ncbi:MAG: hypothetical protein R3Y56_10020, partial [Akkermansia sp.]